MPPFVKKSEPLKFNRWTFVREGSRQIMWVCRCDCGTVKEVNKKNVKAGLSKSCGCHNVERLKARRINPDTAEFRTWRRIICRCTNKKDPRYDDYGGRGITVCQRWLDSYDDFLKDMGPRPSDDHSIERKDNEKGYSPDNCKWATRSEQQRNKRCTKLYTLAGKTQSVTAWAEEYGVEPDVLWYRLNNGWDLKAALIYPKGRPRGLQAGKPETRPIEWNGVTKTMGEWAEEFGIPVRIFNERLRMGWSMALIQEKPLSHLAKTT